MNCDTAQELLLDHVEGVLDARQAGELKAHLDTCDTCRLALQQTRELLGAIDHIKEREAAASRSGVAGKSLPSDLVDWEKSGRLGDFDILGEIGRGGMGIVYRARQISLNRQIALKVLPGLSRQMPDAVTRFQKEAQAAAKLHHTNIVPVYAQGDCDGHVYYAMELIDGQSLDRILREDPARIVQNLSSRSLQATDSQLGKTELGRREGYRFVARLIAGVAEGLEHAHRHGVIHRDIKPQNLLMAPDGQLHITDFGLARLLDEPSITLTGEMVGTPAYMSPEQVRGDRKSIDHHTDIYSLGVTFYEVLTGRRPFEGATRDQIVARILTREPKPPRKIDPHIPFDLETICLRAMEKSSARRYATAGEMAVDLRRFADDRPIFSRRAGPVEKAVKWVRRHPALTTICTLVLVLMTGATLWGVQTVRARHARANDLVREVFDLLAYEDYREPKQALAKLDQAALLGADDRAYHVALGLAHLNADPQAAIRDLSRAIQNQPVQTESMYLLAWAMRLQANRVNPAAKSLLDTADALGGPTTAAGHFFRGQVLIREEDEAEKEFRHACEMRQNNTQASLHLGRALNHWMYHHRRHDKYDEQKRRLLFACDMQTGQAYPRYLLSIAHRLSAEIYADAGNYTAADEDFRAALEAARSAQQVEPSNARGFVAEAEYWETRRDYELALALRNKSAPLCTKPEPLLELYRYRWRLHYWTQRYDSALADLQKLADSCSPADPMRTWYVGAFPALIHAEQGEPSRAADLLRQAAADNPTSFRAVTSAACILRILGRDAEADRLLADHAEKIEFHPVGQADVSADFLRAAYELCRGKSSLEDVMAVAGPKHGQRQTQAIPYFFAAAQALAHGDRAQAFAHFKTADASFDSEDYCYLARVFVRRMERDPAWPPWLPRSLAPPDRSTKKSQPVTALLGPLSAARLLSPVYHRLGFAVWRPPNPTLAFRTENVIIVASARRCGAARFPPTASRTLALFLRAAWPYRDAMSDDAPKIHIDDDWKKEAAREKERLAETADAGPAYRLPQADFLGLVQMIAMQAVVGLGGLAGPGGQEIPPNLELAKHHIDMLDVLDSKTKGNLDPNEKAALDTTLHQLRLAYVETIRAAMPASGA